MAEAKWYVVSIPIQVMKTKSRWISKRRLKTGSLQDQILEVSVPLQDAIEVKNGVKKQVQILRLCPAEDDYER